MKAGDVINGYRILEDFKVVGAGLSKWTFAERGGRQYFIKEFLSPTYPEDDAPGSEKIKAKKRARCAAFEAHHRGVQRALAPLSAYGGNLIVTLDFFRWGAKYYKITEKVDAEGLTIVDIAALGLRVQLVLMKTVAHSLKILHDLKIVPGDLKPSNVLIKRTELGYATKLIDFDHAYIAGADDRLSSPWIKEQPDVGLRHGQQCRLIRNEQAEVGRRHNLSGVLSDQGRYGWNVALSADTARDGCCPAD